MQQAVEIDCKPQENEVPKKDDCFEERTRIAQELHDTLLQTFLSASMQLSIALEGIAPEAEVKARLHRILQLINQGIEEGRSTIHGLRSDGLPIPNLAMALANVQHELALEHKADFRVRVVGREKLLRPLVQHEAYRIAREALVNAFCHSQATRIELEIQYTGDELRIRVRDDGSGIDDEVLKTGKKRHWGLAGMRERAARIGARLEISSAPELGTQVKLSVASAVAFQH